jgi:prepilin-type N-terminal cleavage/methylation domain-containing protein
MRRGNKRGFTLIELAIVVAIVSLLTTLAVGLLRQVQSSGRARDGMRQMLNLINEARSTAMILGSAAGSPRVTLDSSCPAAFSTVLGTANGQGGLLIQPSPSLAITYINQITAIAPASTTTLETYVISCKTADFASDYQNNVTVTAITGVSPLVNGSGYFLAFDGRGFTRGTTAPVASITAADQQTSHIQQNILIMGSGFACLEGRYAQRCSS